MKERKAIMSKWILSENLEIINADLVAQFWIGEDSHSVYARPSGEIIGSQLCKCSCRKVAENIIIELSHFLSDPDVNLIHMECMKDRCEGFIDAEQG